MFVKRYKITGTIGLFQKVDLIVEEVENFDLEELLKKEAKSKQKEGAF